MNNYNHYNRYTDKFENSKLVEDVKRLEAKLYVDPYYDFEQELHDIMQNHPEIFVPNFCRIRAYGHDAYEESEKSAEQDYDDDYVLQDSDIKYIDSSQAQIIDVDLFDYQDGVKVVFWVNTIDDTTNTATEYLVRPTHIVQLDTAPPLSLNESLYEATQIMQYFIQGNIFLNKAPDQYISQIISVLDEIYKNYIEQYKGKNVTIQSQELYTITVGEEINWEASLVDQFSLPQDEQLKLSGQIAGVTLPELMELADKATPQLTFPISSGVPHLIVNDGKNSDTIYLVPFTSIDAISVDKTD